MKLNWKLKSWEELTKDELYELLALRSEVFVVEQDCVFQDMDFKDQAALHLLGLDEEGVVRAYSRLYDKDQYYEGHQSIGRIVTHGATRKHGYGEELLTVSIKECEEAFGEGSIKIGAQKYLVRFYEKFGFKEVGEDYIEDGIPHCIMIRG
ncbi:GNAT family N-acetyltransferase [Jiulongibacter sp. NS-SX5]|uniref:GNAT family N-acetyltransferase n=1 Tax=Jiulongibacter sp. NS-SX5 TaxID=3463854 RepID=UPI004059DFD5